METVAERIVMLRGTERGVSLWKLEKGYLVKDDSFWNEKDWADFEYKYFIPALWKLLVCARTLNYWHMIYAQPGSRY